MKHTATPWIKMTHIHTSECGREDEYFNHEFHLLTSSKVEYSNEIGNATAELLFRAPELLEENERLKKDKKEILDTLNQAYIALMVLSPDNTTKFMKDMESLIERHKL